MKILIVTKNWLGDTLFQFPAIEAIHQFYPDAEIVCLAPARCCEVLEAHPAIKRVIIFDEKKEHRSWFARFRFVMELRKESWDKAYLFHRSRTRAMLLWFAGVKERIGYGKRRKMWLTRSLREPEGIIHQTEYFLELVRQTGIPALKGTPYHFYVSWRDQKKAEEKMESLGIDPQAAFVCFHLGANWEPKRWPVSHFARFAKLIHDQWGFRIIATGAASDQPLADELAHEAGKEIVLSVVGRTSLGELAAIYKRARFVVSGDSGPMHIASGIGAPVVALFGPTDPDRTGPGGEGKKIVLRYVPAGYMTPWYGKNLPEEGWLSQITPEQVMQAIEKARWFSAHRGTHQAGNISIEESENLLPLTLSRSLFRRNGRGVKNILFVTLSNIGDVILTTPVLMALVSEFPKAKLTVVCGPRTEELLKKSAYIDRVVVYDKHKSFWERLRFIKELRRVHYDWVVDLRHSLIPYLVRAGKRSPFFRSLKSLGMRDRHLEVLAKTGLVAEKIPHFDFFDAADIASMFQKLKQKGIPPERRFIVASPRARSSTKTWRFEGFREVFARLLEEYPENILLVGEEQDRPVLEAFASINPERIWNFAGDTSLRELAWLISESSLVLTNDSAVMHLGYELDRPVAAIFGPTNHEKYGRTGEHFRIIREGVSCSPCEAAQCRFERQACFEDLNHEKVLEVCRQLLNQKTGILHSNE